MSEVTACPKCGHAAHARFCYNMASDNECGCAFGVPDTDTLVTALPQPDNNEELTATIATALREHGINVATSSSLTTECVCGQTITDDDEGDWDSHSAEVALLVVLPALAAARKEGQAEAINWIESYGATVPGKRIGRAAFFARLHFTVFAPLPPTEKSE